MTLQSPERLQILDADLSMVSFPLEDYFLLIQKRFEFPKDATILRRGYIGHWQIIEDHLYLNEIRTLFSGATITLTEIFPDATDKVFAHWYTGSLDIIIDNFSSKMIATDRIALKLQIRDGKLTKSLSAAFSSVNVRDFDSFKLHQLIKKVNERKIIEDDA